MSNRKVCVVTGTRAEYGLFYPILKRISISSSLELQLVATTMHLSNEFGLTYREIESDGFIINEKIENLLSADSESSIAKSTGLAMILLSDTFKRLKPDVVLLLGDRYETHAAASTAMLMKIPIAHIHGGEITEGAIDEQIRHSITKMSFLHFATTSEYKRRLLQMGELEENVIISGAPGIDNIVNADFMEKNELEIDLNWSLKSEFALFTYNPETLFATSSYDIDIILGAIKQSGINVLFTYANADNNGRVINQKLDSFVETDGSMYKVVKSLGKKRYLSAMKLCSLVIGNSSSGIIEAASFNKPVVNIGDRQKGRMQSGNVVNCMVGDTAEAIQRALSSEFINKCQDIVNIYGDGHAAKRIVDALEAKKPVTIKTFQDIK